MSDTVSVRQRIIDDMVATLLRSGLVDVATDEELPAHERSGKGWVFEGDEDEDQGALESYTEASLLVFVHTTFEFDASDPHRQPLRIGRDVLARHQKLFLEDHTRGGYAWNTAPAGNSIGVSEPAPTTRGVVESRWRVKYHRKRLDPYDRG